VHERFFGFLRPDGSLKPSAQAVRAFALTQPTVSFPERTVDLHDSAGDYYADPLARMAELYERFGRLA
jgi:hypothetical protein